MLIYYPTITFKLADWSKCCTSAKDNFYPVRALLCAIPITFHVLMMMMMMTTKTSLLFLFDVNIITIFVPVN